jgi:hypothetical protein
MTCPNRNHPTRTVDICADEAEVLALALLRFVAAGYLTSDVACWEAARDKAEQALGPVVGSQAVAAMTAVLRAVRRERQGDWRFMPATCCRATGDECGLIDLIGLARGGGVSELQRKAAEFAGSGEAPHLCASLMAAAGMLSLVQPQLARSRPVKARAMVH